MKILHYTPKENGIRFFRTAKKYLENIFNDFKSISDLDGIYKAYRTPSEFKDRLRYRIDLPDMVVIMAHGWHDSILQSSSEGYKRVINLDEAKLLKNNFVFALSCYTCKEFGKCAVDNDALTYIGFDDTIEQVFIIKNDKYRNLARKLEVVIKKIYIHSFIIEFEKFVKNCSTANEFYQRLSLRINMEVAKLSKMGIEELNKKFCINITDSESDKANEIIRLEIVGKFDYINEKMKLLGEKNYIPWYFIFNQSEGQLQSILLKSEQIADEHYKYFIQTIIYEKLGLKSQVLEAMNIGLKLAEKKGQPFFYKKVFTG